jgi:hypothetical protein
MKAARSSVFLALLVLGTACTHLNPRIAPPSADRPCLQTAHGCIALNPDVSETNIRQTICVPGYTRAVRPSTSYTNGVKQKLLRAAGLDPASPGRYELDHLIPLALGGHPRKLSNLVLQPWECEHGARRKDTLEVHLHALVCRGTLKLRDAQRCIGDDWEACAARH